ncbi:MAG TPA: GNAT family N-acetyltransferase [Thermoanaerobaculia bacterium]|jgi:aminoglycoside 6'-N-acetyltransferase I
MTIRVRPARPADTAALVRMRRALWPEGSAAEHRSELLRYFRGRSREPLGVLIAETERGRPVGFAEVSIRAYAEDCSTDRVGFLEGWWVAPGERRKGVGRLLMEASEAWARKRRCLEFASDALPGNRASIAAHRALGFADAGTVVCFRKELAPARRSAK